ncbi:hypothetical protein Cri9333_0395 [Crinalium epipsammum PCC 9333]|uniref:Uncharacterized protein n=1 Tax=Crinalium epipsammum PCC 9333 TaxID=1173022 RepID=K9VUY3_9CYAN|nr:hypothetical protein [Crinalium epipsammum]AFZ11369.1 hypothetical protein Cri9333_0395 [Crinalium epipsammum PCC 9333]
MKSISMGTFREYDCKNTKALLNWLKENYQEIAPNKFVLINGDSAKFSSKELITRAAIEGIVARQWATLEISRLSLTDNQS